MRSLKLFGQFDLGGPEGKSVAASAKLSALLAFLVAAGKPVGRDQLTGLLWGSYFEDQAKQNFRQALARLRKALGSEVVLSDDYAVRLAPGAIRSDLAEFESLAKSRAADDLKRAAQLLGGDLLAGFDIREEAFEEWLSSERRRLGSLACDVLERLGRLELEAGRPDEALRLAEDCLRRDIFREDAHRLTIAALSALGRKSEAIRRYQHLEERLKQELGTAPEAATTAEFEKARQNLGMTVEPAPAVQARRPSIAVLPFANLSADPQQDYFSEGVVDDVITALSRLHWLFVIARNSSFAYKGRAVDVKQVGRELGVRYVLDGSVRRAGNRLRIAGQLIDTTTGSAIWADRFDGDMADLFELQDMVTSQVVGAIAPKLEQAEIERSRRKPTESLDAYDHYLRGQAEVNRWTLDGNRAAMAHFYKAAGLDPQFATAFGMAARCYSQRKTQGWDYDPAFDHPEVRRLARTAVELGPDDPIALAASGMALAFVAGELEAGSHLIARSLELNPNYATGWMFLGWTASWLGEPDRAIDHVTRAMHMSPHDPSLSNMRRAIAFAYFVAGRYEEAISASDVAVAIPQNLIFGYATVAASAAILGRQAQAGAAMEKLRLADPTLRVSSLPDRYPLRRESDRQRWQEGLRKAGLPE
ncbi:BTAD domain-containing putative transcriptional regulator [Aestuariivirga sp.]|uniref:BTAD domain-containing putative transcriptional regulator n=1 Tax=Aestuariivirga sp. TaxID=2650926 RepID=UPI00391C73FC